MAEDKPEQDPSEDSRETINHELEREQEHPHRSRDGEKQEERDEKIAIPTPVEPGDQNAQTTPPI